MTPSSSSTFPKDGDWNTQTSCSTIVAQTTGRASRLPLAVQRTHVSLNINAHIHRALCNPELFSRQESAWFRCSTWNLDLPWNKMSSTLSDRPWPGHMVLSSVNQPALATPMPSAAVPGFALASSWPAILVLSLLALPPTGLAQEACLITGPAALLQQRNALLRMGVNGHCVAGRLKQSPPLCCTAIGTCLKLAAASLLSTHRDALSVGMCRYCARKNQIRCFCKLSCECSLLPPLE